MNIAVIGDKIFVHDITDIQSVTIENILELWRYFCKDMKHEKDIYTKRNRNHIKGFISNESVIGILSEQLNQIKKSLLTDSSDCLIPVQSSFEALLCHLLCDVLYLSAKTEKMDSYVAVHCRDVSYWGDFEKAFKIAKEKGNGTTRPEDSYEECGCDLVPDRIRDGDRYQQDMDYDDTEMTYFIPRKKCTGVRIKIR